MSVPFVLIGCFRYEQGAVTFPELSTLYALKRRAGPRKRARRAVALAERKGVRSILFWRLAANGDVSAAT